MLKMKNLKVNVTQEMINRGEKGSETACPVALGFWEAGAEMLSVTGEDVFITLRERERNTDYSGRLPKDVQYRIEEFDTFGEDVLEPFEFEVELIEREY